MRRAANVEAQLHESYSWKGDVIHAATVLNTIVYCMCTLFFKDNTSIFDSTWAKEGFCISNATIPYWTSFDLCLYADLILASLCGIAYFLLHKENGMKAANELVFFNLFGVAAHGLGHGATAANLRDPKWSEVAFQDIPYTAGMDEKTWADLLLEQGPFFIFCVVLLKASMPKTNIIYILLFSVLSWLGGLAVKPSFQFTYVQTFLLIAFSFNQLNRPKEEKGFTYYIYGLLVSFPVGIVGWIESTMCSSTIIHIGGHVCYDAYIPISTLAFYLICYTYRESETAKLKSN